MRDTETHAGLASQAIREKMVQRLREQGIRDTRVLEAMLRIPRHAFVDAALSSRAYEDCSLPIGFGQTISQPHVVARTIELALAGVSAPGDLKVLEIGTGCGYAAAVLSRIVGSVYSIERVRALHQRARSNVRSLRIANLHLLHGDGIGGLAAHAPFDAIVAAAAGPDVPSEWLDQLRPGGVVVAPVGGSVQRLTVFRRDASGRVVRKAEEEVRFVPIRAGVQ